jgi:hypothetical protein
MRPNRFYMLSLFCAATVAALAVQPARASLIVSAQSVSAVVGTSGNTFDITLTNTGPTDVTIGGFSFGISTASPNIDFTGASTTTTTAPYIFAGDSFVELPPGFPLNTSSGQSLAATDLSASGNGTVVGAGDTLGLGEVFFDVAAGTTVGQIIVVTLDASQTSLSDPAGTPITVDTLANGSIAPTPEPSTLVLFSASLVALAGGGWRGRRCLQDKV